MSSSGQFIDYVRFTRQLNSRSEPAMGRNENDSFIWIFEYFQWFYDELNYGPNEIFHIWTDGGGGTREQSSHASTRTLVHPI